MRKCKKKGIGDPDWNVTREKYNRDRGATNSTAVVKCCTHYNELSNREKQDCGQMYMGGLKGDCNILNRCSDPSTARDQWSSPICKSFAEINKDIPEYQKIALPWMNNWCLRKQSLGVGTQALEDYGCFGDSMGADGYVHTHKFYEQYLKELDSWVGGDKHAPKFCKNANVIKEGWCDDILERQCTKDPRYKDKDECSCYHYMNDGGIGYKNFKAQGIDYEAYKQMVPDPSKAADIAGRMAGELAPVCELIKCTKPGGGWKTKKLNETRCKPCSQVNYNGGRGSSTQNNKCIIKFIDGKFVVEKPEDPPGGGDPLLPKKKNPPDPPIPKKKNPQEPQQGGSVEPSSAQMTKACGKFSKGPDCKKLSGLSVGLITSSAVLLFFLLMLFLFF
jgi:hypothetical protein